MITVKCADDLMDIMNHIVIGSIYYSDYAYAEQYGIDRKDMYNFVEYLYFEVKHQAENGELAGINEDDDNKELEKLTEEYYNRILHNPEILYAIFYDMFWYTDGCILGLRGAYGYRD